MTLDPKRVDIVCPNHHYDGFSGWCPICSGDVKQDEGSMTADVLPGSVSEALLGLGIARLRRAEAEALWEGHLGGRVVDDSPAAIAWSGAWEAELTAVAVLQARIAEEKKTVTPEEGHNAHAQSQ